jgi:hypothetical protein
LIEEQLASKDQVYSMEAGVDLYETEMSVQMATQSSVEVYGSMPDSGQCAVWLHCRQYVIACRVLIGISQTCSVFICLERSDF